MSLIPKTNAQLIAEEIDASQKELLRHVQAMLLNIYAQANTSGEQQAILDSFGTNGVKALTAYSAMFQAVSAINPSTNIPVPDLTGFVPQADGTVVYVAPPIIESETTPIPKIQEDPK